MSRLGTVDERYQSYNIEMVEVTGGRFWKPYKSVSNAPAPAPQPGAQPSGLPADLFEYRPPTDLASKRLRNLAAALGPAYVRVSGTWANSVYFHDSDGPVPPTPPAGFNAILTRNEWKGVIDFARAANAKLVTSFATSTGTRDAAGVWTPEQAMKFVAYTKAAGGSIAAAEFMNEPNFAAAGGAPQGYSPAAYGRDVAVFRRFFKDAAPGALFLGPGSVGEGGVLGAVMAGSWDSEQLLKAASPAFDVFSYHLYAAVSKRCGAAMPAIGTTASAALTAEWLARPEKIHDFYAALRDRFEPGKPMWNTETAQTACGGDAWASTFLDTFRYLIQQARLAQKGLQVIAHNTLASSDYGLLDESTLTPRPNYWAAVLWRRLMGAAVLDPGKAPEDGLYLFAHCMRDHPGGVTVLAVNAGSAPRDLNTGMTGERYTLTAPELQGTAVELNGHKLEANSDGTLPALGAVPVPAGPLHLAGTSITFVAFPRAGNQSCRSN